MPQVRNLFFLFSITIFALASLILCVFNYNPDAANRAIFIDFYLSFLFAIAGILAIIIQYVQIKMLKQSLIANTFWPSVRQGLIYSIGLTTLMFLLGLKILDWITGISVIIVVILLDLFFRTKKIKTT